MLRNYTPPSSDFESYELVKLSSGVSLLIVATPTTVIGKQHKKDIHLQGLNKIVVEFHGSMTNPVQRLNIKPVSILATQEVDTVKTAVADSSKRASESFSYATEHIFDHTALSYVCGFVAMRAAWGFKVKWGGVTNMGILPEKSYSLASNDYIILKKMYNTPQELLTLLHLLKLAGVDNAYIATLSLEATTREMLEGKDLACYCVRLQKMIEATGNTVKVGAHHASAFGRGISAAAIVRSHSAEGGFIRNVCKAMTAPRATGILTEVPRALDRTCTWSVAKSQVRKWLFDTLITFIATVVAGDPCATVSGRVYPVTVSHSSAEPGSVFTDGANWTMYPTLRRNVEDWYYKHLDMMAKAYSFVAPTTYSLAPVEAYFFDVDGNIRTENDRHLCGAEIAPFMWLEPSCISFGDVHPDYPCATLEQPLVLPIFDGEVRPASSYRVLPSGDVSADSTIFLVQESMSFRHCGLWYVLNSAYNKQDGLAGYLHTVAPRLGYNSWPAFTKPGVQNMADASWGLWDTCHPHPLNGLTEQFKVLWRHTTKNTKTEWTIEEYKSQTVMISQGAFSLQTKYEGSNPKTFQKYVPPSIYNVLRELDPYDAVGAIYDDEFMAALSPCVGTVGGLSPTQFAHTYMTSRLSAVTLEFEEPTRVLTTDAPHQLADEHPVSKKTKVANTVEPNHDWDTATGRGEEAKEGTRTDKVDGRDEEDDLDELTSTLEPNTVGGEEDKEGSQHGSARRKGAGSFVRYPGALQAAGSHDTAAAREEVRPTKTF